jgi:hypothetical protein
VYPSAVQQTPAVPHQLEDDELLELNDGGVWFACRAVRTWLVCGADEVSESAKVFIARSVVSLVGLPTLIVVSIILPNCGKFSTSVPEYAF